MVTETLYHGVFKLKTRAAALLEHMNTFESRVGRVGVRRLPI